MEGRRGSFGCLEELDLLGATECEVWDVMPPQVPDRSRLYGLSPKGMGTPLVEALSSYLSRLAEAHGVNTATLLREVVTATYTPPFAQVNTYMRFRFNGWGTTATYLVYALGALCRRDDLRYLTLMKWSDVLSEISIFRDVLAWCPLCYESWRESSSVVYVPLLWHLKSVNICPVHSVWLQTRCRCCRQETSAKNLENKPGYCKCGEWLGSSKVGRSSREERSAQFQQEVWLAESTGEMLAAMPVIEPPSKQNIANLVLGYAAQLGTPSDLASAVGMSSLDLYHYYGNSNRVSLPQLLDLCIRLGVRPVRIFNGSLEDILDAGVVVSPLTRDRPVPRLRRTNETAHYDLEQARKALQDAIAVSGTEPPSVTSVARTLGCCATWLLKRLPDEYGALVAKRAEYARERAVQNRRLIIEDVLQIAQDLIDEGIRPSSHQLAKRLSRPGVLLGPEIRQVLREKRDEMDRLRSSVGE